MEVKRDTTLMEDSLALIHQNCKCICPLTQQSQFQEFILCMLFYTYEMTYVQSYLLQHCNSKKYFKNPNGGQQGTS